MLSGAADVMLGYDGFIDAAEGLAFEADVASWGSIVPCSVGGLSGNATVHLHDFDWSSNNTIREAQAGPEVQGGGSSTSDPAGPGLPATITHDVEPIRLPADESFGAAPEGGLIDLTRVLNEPVGLARCRPARREEGSDRTGSVLAKREGGKGSESWNGRGAFELAASWGARVSSDISPDHVRPASLRDSPFRPIEGARGLSQAFELATSGDESLAAADSPDRVPRAFRFSSPSHEPVGSPQGPDRASSDQPSPGREPLSDVPGKPSDRTLASVAERAAEAGAGHEALFAELAKPLGEAVLNAVYLENKRATDLIPLLAVAALTHHLASRRWDKPVNDRIGVAYPRRRHPLCGGPRAGVPIHRLGTLLR